VRELLEVSGTSDLFPTVAEVDPYRIGVARSRYADEHQDPYVPRDVDADLDAMFNANLFVCVAGPPAAGKSRTAIEAARRVLPDAILLVLGSPPER
jgi:superfamily II DNA or RNA helicase